MPNRYNVQEIAGQTFGRWTVIGPAGATNNSGSRLWLCRCSCGAESKKTVGGLRKVTADSGCISCYHDNRGLPKAFIDMTGQRFGSWTVLRRSERVAHGKKTFWLCRCDCGAEVDVYSGSLRIGSSARCLACRASGKKGNKNAHWSGHGGISGTFWGATLANARHRGIPVELSIEEAWALFEAQRGKCALTGFEIQLPKACSAFFRGLSTASLDRIDSSIGYVPSNVQWVHKDVNQMKLHLPEARFKEICAAISDRMALCRVSDLAVSGGPPGAH